MGDDTLELLTESPADTREMARAFAEVLRPNDVIALSGTLGAGKTCFVQGLARGLGVPEGTRVISPTFVLMRSYSGRLDLYHFDAYRLSGAAEMEEIGCAEVFRSGGVSVVEWAERVEECLPEERIALSIATVGPQERAFRLTAHGPGAESRMVGFRGVLERWT